MRDKRRGRTPLGGRFYTPGWASAEMIAKASAVPPGFSAGAITLLVVVKVAYGGHLAVTAGSTPASAPDRRR